MLGKRGADVADAVLIVDVDWGAEGGAVAKFLWLTPSLGSVARLEHRPAQPHAVSCPRLAPHGPGTMNGRRKRRQRSPPIVGGSGDGWFLPRNIVKSPKNGPKREDGRHYTTAAGAEQSPARRRNGPIARRTSSTPLSASNSTRKCRTPRFRRPGMASQETLGLGVKQRVAALAVGQQQVLDAQPIAQPQRRAAGKGGRNRDGSCPAKASRRTGNTPNGTSACADGPPPPATPAQRPPPGRATAGGSSRRRP